MMMRSRWLKRWIGLMVFFCLTCGFAVSGYAADGIDQEKAVTLELIYQDEHQAIAYAEFHLYLVADMAENGKTTLSGDFAKYPVKVDAEDGENWRNLAMTLYGYAQRDQLQPLEIGKTDENGYLKFSGEKNAPLKPALYLVTGSKYRCNGIVYFAEPFLVWLPDYNKELAAWVYDVQAVPKFERKPDSGGTDTVTRKVLKVWNDSGYTKKRPKNITVQLLKDGIVYDTVTLTEDSNWRYTWENLSDIFQWMVVEQEQNPYTVEVSRDGITFVVTNTYQPTTSGGGGHRGGDDDDDSDGGSKTPGEPSVPDTESIQEESVPMAQMEPEPLPQTGQLWWPVPMLIAGGLLFLILSALLFKRSENEK